METKTITQLRAIKTPGTSTKYCIATDENFIAWKYDPLDKTSKDDGINCIVTSTGKRIKRVVNKKYLDMLTSIISAGNSIPTGGGGGVVVPPPNYQNTTQSYTATCGPGYSGTPVTVTKAANTYSSLVSVAEANAEALAAATSEATAALVCTLITPDPLATPTLTATVISGTQINLSWTNVAGETSYLLQMSTNGSTWSTINSPAADVTTYSKTGLTPNTNYYFRVQAIGNPVTSTPSGYGTTSATTSSTYPRTADININAATAYGIVSNGSTDNATALNTMRAAYANSNQMLEITFPSGQMNYSDNTWVEGLRNVRYKPSSGIMQWNKTGGSVFDIAYQPIATSGVLNYNKKASYVGTLNTGYLFATATAGANSITATGTGLVAGDRVFLAGYECQGSGWPPNPRFFEWKTVQSVVGSTITFTTPLERSYNSMWKDWDWGGGYFFGKPRIFKVPANYAEYVEIKNADMLIQGELGNAFHYPARTLILENVEFHGGVWPSENETFKAINCTGGGWELDKCVGEVELNGVTVDTETQGATGVKSLRLINCTMGGYCAITPQNLYAEGTTFLGGLAGNAAIYAFEYYTGCDTWTFKDCVFPNVQTAFECPTLTFTVASVSSGNIVIPDHSDPAHANHKPAKLIYQGSTITSGANSATVTDIIHVLGNYHLILSNVVGIVGAGQVWTYRQIKNVVDLGGNHKANGTPITISL